MDDDRILVELTVVRRYRMMGPEVQRLYLVGREVLRVAVAAVLGVALFRHLEGPAAVAGTVGLVWLLTDPWIRSERPGESRVLLTDSGIHVVESGFFCPWDGVVFHAVAGNVLFFEPDPDVVPRRPFGLRRHRIPLGPDTRARIKALFAERTRGASRG